MGLEVVLAVAGFVSPLTAPSPGEGLRCLIPRLQAPVGLERAQLYAVAGRPSPSDEDDFIRSPRSFCEKQLRAHGSVFATGAFDGAVFVGDAKVLTAISSVESTSADQPILAAPFASVVERTSSLDPFEEYAEAFNDVCYEVLFSWIPRYKEAGFSTFRFEDFIDGRVRKLRASCR